MDSVDKKLLPLDFKCTLSTTLAKRKVQAQLPKEEVSMGTEATRSPKELPIACKLTNEEQQKRREELSRELFYGREGTRELDDGYEFVFAGGADWAEKLVSFVVSERVLPLLYLRADLRARRRTHLTAGARPRRGQGVHERGVRRWLVLQ